MNNDHDDDHDENYGGDEEFDDGDDAILKFLCPHN